MIDIIEFYNSLSFVKGDVVSVGKRLKLDL